MANKSAIENERWENLANMQYDKLLQAYKWRKKMKLKHARWLSLIIYVALIKYLLHAFYTNQWFQQTMSHWMKVLILRLCVISSSSDL